MNKKLNILLVSNTQLSTTDSNGKTLLSIFQDDIFNVYHFYVKNSNFPSDKAISELRVSDIEVLKNKKNPNEFKKIENETDVKTIIEEKKVVKKTVFKQLLRELLWKFSKFQYSELKKWVNQYKFDAIFFMMGDAVFMCDIVDFLHSYLNIPLFVYITDVYINEITLKKPIEYIYKKNIERSQKKIIENTDKLYVISEKMKEFYQFTFTKSSFLLRNLQNYINSKDYQRDIYDNFIYAGNLYYGRDRVLCKFAEEIKEYNEENGKSHKLIIYSQSHVTSEIKNEMYINEYLDFKGGINSQQLTKVLIENKYALFVESFEKENIEKVKYSFSTKITELAALGKCVVSIGPRNVSSIIELEKFGYLIDDLSFLKSKLEYLLKKDDFLEYEQKAKYISNNCYNNLSQTTMLYNDFVDCLNSIDE